MAASKGISKLSLFHIPFEPHAQLCDELILEDNGAASRLLRKTQGKQWLPGQPRISLDSKDLIPYVQSEFLTPRLDRLSSYLWLVATQSSSHISPLHDQIVRGRNVVISEKPELHLVWHDTKVFLKPIPSYCFSHDFWRFVFDSELSPRFPAHEREGLLQAVRGYMRSYYYLIRHESDFRIAREEHLLPDGVEWEEFASFISGFANVVDDEASARYHFGELRLARLNLWAKIVLHQWQFQKTSWQYGDYFARLFAPILFLFGALSVALSAMQVGVGARPSWEAFQSASAWFSVVTLVIICIITFMLVGAFAFMSVRELNFAVKDIFRKSRKPQLTSC